MRHAYARDVQARNPHQLAIRTDEPDILDEALELARQAYADVS